MTHRETWILPQLKRKWLQDRLGQHIQKTLFSVSTASVSGHVAVTKLWYCWCDSVFIYQTMATVEGHHLCSVFLHCRLFCRTTLTPQGPITVSFFPHTNNLSSGTLFQSEGQRSPGGLHLRLGRVQSLPAPLQRCEGAVRGRCGFWWCIQPKKERHTGWNAFSLYTSTFVWTARDHKTKAGQQLAFTLKCRLFACRPFCESSCIILGCLTDVFSGFMHIFVTFTQENKTFVTCLVELLCCCSISVILVYFLLHYRHVWRIIGTQGFCLLTGHYSDSVFPLYLENLSLVWGAVEPLCSNGVDQIILKALLDSATWQHGGGWIID